MASGATSEQAAATEALLAEVKTEPAQSDSSACAAAATSPASASGPAPPLCSPFSPQIAPAGAAVSAASSVPAAAAAAGAVAAARPPPLSRSPFSPNFCKEAAGAEEFAHADSSSRGRRRTRDSSEDDRRAWGRRSHDESPDSWPQWYGGEDGAWGGAWSNHWQTWWQRGWGQQSSQAWSGSWPVPVGVAWMPLTVVLPQSQTAAASGDQGLVPSLRQEAKATMRDAAMMMMMMMMTTHEARRGMRAPGGPSANAANRQRREGAGRAERATQLEMDMASAPQLVRMHLLWSQYSWRFSSMWGIIRSAQCLELLYAS